MRIRTVREIGLLVRTERKRQGLTLQGLAEQVGCTRQWICALGLVTKSRQRRPLRLAMAIGGTTAVDEIDRAAWLREVERSRLPKRQIAEVAELAARVAGEAPGVTGGM
jgi:transcriptional regulator with XRE-family HTH domain